MIEGLKESNREKSYYLSILENDNEGTPFRIRVKEDVKNAKRRDYTTKDGAAKSVHELCFAEVTNCYIKGVEKRIVRFNNGNSMDVLEVKFQPENPMADPLKLQLGTQSGLASDLLKKLPGLDFEKPVSLGFYNFIPDGESKSRKGFILKQNDEKVLGQFYDPGTKSNKHGFPEVNEAQKTATGYWKFYFAQVFDFLYDYYLNVLKAKVEATIATAKDANADFEAMAPEHDEAPADDNEYAAPENYSASGGTGPRENEDDDLPF